MSTDFGDITRPIARKAHRCEWCGESILECERHVKFSGKWKGEFQNWRMHAECYSLADENDDLSEGFSPYEHERPDAELSNEEIYAEEKHEADKYK